MATLLLMRHAKSSWDHPAATDFERPLKKRGRQAARRMALKLLEEQLVPDVILCSTAARARETSERMIPFWDPAPRVVLRDDLYHASPSQLVATVREFDGTSAKTLVVAHNPGMEILASRWAAKPVRFPTAAIARFEPELENWGELELASAVPLVSVWRPSELPDLDDPGILEDSE
ncbi:MAG TPA: histidine phosphatase family protein [Planctomycetaceae bacterium]|nr:histidine phosphatase family protein [Planctomycetaceae bacterium]